VEQAAEGRGRAHDPRIRIEETSVTTIVRRGTRTQIEEVRRNTIIKEVR